MNRPIYPLEELAQIKKKRLESAEKVLQEKRSLLESEEKRLKEIQERFEEVKKHKAEKIERATEEENSGTTSDRILMTQRYLKYVVNEKLKQEQANLDAQQRKVESAKEEVRKAKELYLKCNQDVEKMRMHKDRWLIEVKKGEALVEANQTDEIGSALHLIRTYQSKESP